MAGEEPSTSTSSAQLEDLSSWSNFPELNDTVWKWADNGLNEKLCPIEFVQDEPLVKVNKKLQKQSYWRLENDGKVLEVKFNNSVRKLRYLPKERKAVVINSDTSPAHDMWETLKTLLDYERRGKELAGRYCSSEEKRPFMSPQAPRNTYKDQYPDNAAQNNLRIGDNIERQGDYEAEVTLYRALERLDNRIIVLHGFEYTHYQYILCERLCIPSCDMKGKNAKDSTEGDYLIIGENFFVVIPVKNTSIDEEGSRCPLTAFHNSLVQRNRVKELIQFIHPEATVLLFTAFPSLDLSSFDQFYNTQESSKRIELEETEKKSIIFKNNLEGLNLRQWWLDNVQQKVPPVPVNNSEHEKVKHIMLAISCTNKEGVPDDTSFNLAKTVMRVDNELKESEITLEQQFKNANKLSINTGVVKAPDIVKKCLGIEYWTKEQGDIFES